MVIMMVIQNGFIIYLLFTIAASYFCKYKLSYIAIALIGCIIMYFIILERLDYIVSIYIYIYISNYYINERLYHKFFYGAISIFVLLIIYNDEETWFELNVQYS